MVDLNRTYTRNVMMVPVLKEDEEHHLIREAKNGNLQARNRLVESHLKLVVKIAMSRFAKIARTHLPDLIGEGNMALVKAIERFDPAYGVRLSSFVKKQIYWAMHNYAMQLGWAMKLPKEQAIRAIKFRKGDELQKETDSRGTAEGKQQRRRDIQWASSPVVSLHNAEEFEIPVENENPADVASKNEKIQMLEAALERLPDREKDVILCRIGLHSGRRMPLREVANILGVSIVRVSQLEKQGLSRLKNALSFTAH